MRRPERKPPFTRDEIRDLLAYVADELDEWDLVIGDPPPNSDLADIKKTLQKATTTLSRLSFQLYMRGVEAAEPGHIT